MSEDEANASFAQQEDLIRTCMRGQGFDYVPRLPVIPRPDAVATRGSREAAEKFGYGINTSDSVPFRSQDSDQANRNITAAMTSSEQRAYDAALYGDTTDLPLFDPNKPDAELVYTDDQIGCYGVASRTVFGGDVEPPPANPDVIDFNDRLTAMRTDIESDPQVTAALSAWSECMSNAGSPGLLFLHSGEASVAERTSDAYGYTYSDLGNGSYGVESVTQGVTPPLPANLVEVKADLVAFEISTAVRDFDCRLPYNTIHDTVRVSHEQQFLTDNKDLIERLRALPAA